MNHLEMPNSKFEIRITQTTDSKSFVLNNEKFVKIYPDGFDESSFYYQLIPVNQQKAAVKNRLWRRNIANNVRNKISSPRSRSAGHINI